MLQAMNQKGQKGFTLVELMIVVAIIGILAAIAIPQFAQYRIRGFNASAMSDLRNLNTTQAAFFTDWNRYGITTYDDAVATTGSNGTVLLGGKTLGTGEDGYFIGSNTRTTPLVVGSNVTIVAHTSNADTAAGLAGVDSTFVAAAKHVQGNTIYAVDADASAIYRDPDTLAVGLGLDDVLFTAEKFPQTDKLTTGDDLAPLTNFEAS